MTTGREAHKRWRLANPDKVRANVARYRAKNKDKMAAATAKWQRENPEKRRHSSRKSRGLPDPTRPLPAACECCGNMSNKRVLALDHDHVTGKFRGWLCMQCNRGIGMLGDGTSGLILALAYLERNR